MKHFKQLVEEAKKLTLSQAEKTDIKDQLVLFMRNTVNANVRTAELTRLHSRRSMLSNIQFTPLNNLRSKLPSVFNRVNIFKPMPILIAILLLVSGGASFAAEKSLPGDALYPVKVYVNEEVRGWATLSEEAKANWDAALANRRLNEAEQLASESRLDAETRAQLEANFQAHSDRVQARIEKFEDKKADRAAEIISNFNTSLNAHEQILLSIGLAKNSDTEPQAKSLAVRVRAEAQEAKQDSDKEELRVDAQVEVQTAAEARLNSAENKITEVRKYIASREDRLGATATAQAEARLKVATDLVIQGKLKLEAKAYGEAFRLFQRAHAVAQEAKLLIRAKFYFETRDNVEKNDKDTDNMRTSPFVKPSPSGSARPTIIIQDNKNIRLDGGPIRADGRIRIELGL